MSYILEALQKSEHARQRGKVPDLSTIPATGTGTRLEKSPRHQPYILAGFAVTVLAAVLGWWRPWQQGIRPQEAREEQKIAAAVPRAQVPAPAQTKPTEEIPQRPSISPSGTRAAAVPPPVAPVDAPSITQSARPAEHIEKTPTKAATPAPSAPRPAPVATTPLAPQRPTEASGSPRPASTPSSTRPSSGRIVNLQDLPAAVRNGLPRLTVSGYASAGDSGKRMVVVNDRLVQEGEEAGPGVTVVTVDGDGVVFDYQGHRFRPQ